MESKALTPLSPEKGEEGTVEWHSKLLTDNGKLVIDTPMEVETSANRTQAMETENFVSNDSFENAQRINTQDLITPELYTECGSTQTKNPKKRCRSEPCLSELNTKLNCVCDRNTIPAWLRANTIPPWVMAEDALRLSFWNNSKGRKILGTCYTVPDSHDNFTCYNMTNNKSLFYVRVLCSFFLPQKITIGCYGTNGGKCEFEDVYLDQVVSAVTSISKGAKSKTINLGSIRDGKMKIESVNGSLHFSRLYSNDSKNFVQKNDMSPYLVREDTKCTIPSTEIDHISDVLLDTVQFISMRRKNAHQRQTVFEIAARELRQSEPLSTAQFAIKLFEIYYGLDLPVEAKYPISVVLPEYYKLFEM